MNMTYNDYLQRINEIQKHDRLYYVLHQPEITDYDYDQLYQTVVEIEKLHPEWMHPQSPTQRVLEKTTTGFKQVKHAFPMLSLQNTYEPSEVEAFIQRVEKRLEKEKILFCTELKMDGIAVSLRYEKGILAQALTRGDGKKGDDITANIRAIRSIPLQLHGTSYPEVAELRAEVYMPRNVFQKLNLQKEQEGQEVWANPRNAAAGSLKLLDPKEVAVRGLSVVVYGALSESLPTKSQYEVHALLKEWGLPTFSSSHYKQCSSIEEILHFAHTIESSRKDLPFDIDGIVIKVDVIKWWDLLGTTGKSPRWAVAYKFAPEQAYTQIQEITVQVGRTGVLTPVAELTPTVLAGSCITRATLHNAEEVIRKDIREKDWVVIEKGGDVIPKVVHVDLTKRSETSISWQMPQVCPSCHTRVVHITGEVAIRCPNQRGCHEQKIRQIAYFASKDAMDIRHLGEKVVRQLVEKQMIMRPSDLYTLTKEDLLRLDGFKEKSAEKLFASIETSKHISLSRFILALGIRYVGEETADILAYEAGSMDNLFAIDQEKLRNMSGIGGKMAEAITEFFSQQDEKDEVRRLMNLGVSPQSNHGLIRQDHVFSGTTFVLTGSLETFSRDEAEKLIKERGGKISSSVSKKTDYLLVGEEAGSKLDKAKMLGIRLLDEKTFKELL